MMSHDVAHDKPADSSPDALVTSEQFARQQATRQIGRRRHFLGQDHDGHQDGSAHCSTTRARQ
jgi:hypothetical protein